MFDSVGYTLAEGGLWGWARRRVMSRHEAMTCKRQLQDTGGARGVCATAWHADSPSMTEHVCLSICNISTCSVCTPVIVYSPAVCVDAWAPSSPPCPPHHKTWGQSINITARWIVHVLLDQTDGDMHAPDGEKTIISFGGDRCMWLRGGWGVCRCQLSNPVPDDHAMRGGRRHICTTRRAVRKSKQGTARHTGLLARQYFCRVCFFSFFFVSCIHFTSITSTPCSLVESDEYESVHRLAHYVGKSILSSVSHLISELVYINVCKWFC